MKMRKARHKRSTWVAYRHRTAGSRIRMLMRNFLVGKMHEPGFARRMLDPEGSARIMTSAGLIKAKFDADFAKLPRPTVFK